MPFGPINDPSRYNAGAALIQSNAAGARANVTIVAAPGANKFIRICSITGAPGSATEGWSLLDGTTAVYGPALGAQSTEFVKIDLGLNKPLSVTNGATGLSLSVAYSILDTTVFYGLGETDPGAPSKYVGP